MTRTMRLEVLWAIRDSRCLNAGEKALLYAVETRGIAYGTWETVAADAGMKRDAFYKHRRRLTSRGALTVTERPGRTTIYEVNAGWFRANTRLEIANTTCDNAVTGGSEITNDHSGLTVTKDDKEGDPRRGPLKKPKRASDLPPFNAWDIAEIVAQLNHENICA